MTHDQLVAWTGDQIKYFDFSLKWPDLLSQQIPFGFPLFLRLVGWIDHTYKFLPWLTLVLWATSLAFLGWALRRAGWGIAMVLGIVAPLSVSISMRPWAWHGNPYFYANTERLTAILSVVIFGLVMLAIKEKRWYYLIGALVFVSCLVRSAMLFLPIVIVLMVPRWKMLISVLIPILGFIILRGFVCGDFSFASYGAIQATRIYAMMVEPGDMDKVPQEYNMLMHRILMKHLDTGGIEFDQTSERDLYHRWYHGDEYAKDVVMPYLDESIYTETEKNAWLRELWGYEFRLHWRERLSIYLRSMRVAFGKFPDPALMLGLFFVLVYKLYNLRIYWSITIARPLADMAKWSSLWLVLSILSLLLVQFPDDRYMQICWFWVPSLLGSAIVYLW